MKTHVVTFDLCSNEHLIVWIAAMLIYNAVLILVLAILAFKSADIRFKHFRDTKATNAFAYISIFVSSMTVVYWYFFYGMITIETLDATQISLYIGHTAEALLCQIFLFVPKVYPPILRRFFKSKVRSK